MRSFSGHESPLCLSKHLGVGPVLLFWRVSYVSQGCNDIDLATFDD